MPSAVISRPFSGKRGGFQAAGLSYPNYADLMRSVTTLSGLASWQKGVVALGAEIGGARRVDAEFVMPSYFDILGARLERGRMFTADEDRPPNGTPVVENETADLATQAVAELVLSAAERA